MKTLVIYLITATLAVFTLPLQAGPLTVPNSFSAGTPAVAAEVNGNFSAVKTAVDDNDFRVGTNATAISGNTGNITTNTSDITSNASRITELETASGFVSIPNSAFVNSIAGAETGCHLRHTQSFSYLSAGDDCGTTDTAELYAPIQLPDRATVTGFTCSVGDNTAVGQVSLVGIIYQLLETTSFSSVGSIDYSDGADAGSTGPTGEAAVSSISQRIGDTSTGHIVDNANNSYMFIIKLTHSAANTFADIGTELIISGCKVAYTY